MEQSDYALSLINKFKQSDFYLLSFKIGRDVKTLGIFTSFDKALSCGSKYRKENCLKVFPDIKKINIID